MGLRKERGRVDAPLWLGTFFLFSIAFFQRLVSMRSAPFPPPLLSWKGVAAGEEDEERSWGGEGVRAGRRKVDS